MRQPVTYSLLSNIAVSIGLPVYNNDDERRQRSYPNLTISIKADYSGFLCDLYPTVEWSDVKAELERAFDDYGIRYQPEGIVYIGGMMAYEYEIEA